MHLITRRVSLSIVGAAVAALVGNQTTRARPYANDNQMLSSPAWVGQEATSSPEITLFQEGSSELKTGDIASCHEMENCISGQIMPLTEGTLAGRGVLVQGADCCWRYLDLSPQVTTICSPQPRPDGAGGPVSEPGCLCDPGQVRLIPPQDVPLVYDETTRFGELYFQGLDCEWYRLPCPAICREG
jgi:hypothetical protein